MVRRNFVRGKSICFRCECPLHTGKFLIQCFSHSLNAKLMHRVRCCGCNVFELCYLKLCEPHREAWLPLLVIEFGPISFTALSRFACHFVDLSGFSNHSSWSCWVKRSYSGLPNSRPTGAIFSHASSSGDRVKSCERYILP